MENNKNILILKSPATEWRDAWPSGNGEVGVLVSGLPVHEKIIFNHEKHWLYGEEFPLPDVSSALIEVRELVKNKEYKKAHNYHKEKLHELGYKPKMSDFSPVFTLEIIDKSQNDFFDYSRTLNMETGEITSKWLKNDTTFSRDVFVSRHSGKVHCRFFAEGTGLMNLKFKLSPLAEDLDQDYDSHNLVFSGVCKKDVMVINGHDTKKSWFGGALSFTTDGESESQNDSVLTIKEARMIEIEIDVFADCKEKFQPPIDRHSNYNKELTSHRQLHGELYNRVKLNLKDRSMHAIQQMFDYGRYLLISSAGSQLPPNLQGVWNGDKHPIWNCFYMLNENVQMMHWQILPGNMPEMMLSLFEYYESSMDDFRENALKLFGCRGIFIPANTVPDTGLITDLQGHLIYWTGGAAWLARLYYDYYLYTGDELFLKHRALPFMKEAMDFYEDYTYENVKGELEFCPSISPENSPEDFNREFKMDANCNITINATMDIALCKELLNNLIQGSSLCGVYKENISNWLDVLNKLPGYTINKDGAISEWVHDGFNDNYHHRHVSHIYPFFPGNEISLGDEMIPSIETAVDKRFEIGMREQTGWSLVHQSNIYARLGRGDRALECLDILKEYCTGINLFTYHNDWRDRGVCMTKPEGFNKRVFQIDANLGYPAAIMEMLVHSSLGKITLLPGLPSKMKEGEISGILCRGNILLNMKWSGTQILVELKSKLDQTVFIDSPVSFISSFSTQLEAGKWYSYQFK
ncbi:MAG: glycoside hydrolase family 95 protein [Spirochaetaceae bacterium]